MAETCRLNQRKPSKLNPVRFRLTLPYGLLEDEIIQHGVFRRTRNPQYVGYVLMFLGAAAGSGSQLALISAVLFVAIIHVFITHVEEPHMRRTFGEAFEQYVHKVGRYFGVGEKRSNTD
tara:strand:+ start:1395 stop:1751 length:357 start_codon:yes stop_codon:yes gene_type:complete